MKFLPVVLLAALVACSGEKQPEAKPEAAKEAKAEAKAPPPAHAEAPKPAEPAPAAGGAAATGVPECDAYIAAIENLAKCDKLPQAARDSMKQSADTMKASWKWDGMPEEAKKTAQAAAGSSCKQATDAVKQSMTAAGC